MAARPAATTIEYPERRYAPGSRFDYRPASRWRQADRILFRGFEWGGEVVSKARLFDRLDVTLSYRFNDEVEAVKQVRFEPAQNDGKNVRRPRFTYVYRLRLRNRQGLR